MTNLKNVTIGQNKFCGPAVLSILTGKNTDECANVISRINGSYNITGVVLSDLLKALDKLGFDHRVVEASGGSLYRTLVSLAPNDGMYVVMIKGHYVCVEVKDKKIYFCDNHTKEPIPAASSARLGTQVLTVVKVIEREKPPEPPKPVLISSEINTKVTQQAANFYEVEIYRQNIYNMEEWNKREHIAFFVVTNIADLKTIVHSLISRLNELKGEKINGNH